MDEDARGRGRPGIPAAPQTPLLSAEPSKPAARSRIPSPAHRRPVGVSVAFGSSILASSGVAVKRSPQAKRSPDALAKCKTRTRLGSPGPGAGPSDRDDTARQDQKLSPLTKEAQPSRSRPSSAKPADRPVAALAKPRPSSAAPVPSLLAAMNAVQTPSSSNLPRATSVSRDRPLVPADTRSSYLRRSVSVGKSRGSEPPGPAPPPGAPARNGRPSLRTSIGGAAPLVQQPSKPVPQRDSSQGRRRPLSAQPSVLQSRASLSTITEQAKQAPAASRPAQAPAERYVCGAQRHGTFLG
jgi:hypothetical protein